MLSARLTIKLPFARALESPSSPWHHFKGNQWEPMRTLSAAFYTCKIRIQCTASPILYSVLRYGHFLLDFGTPVLPSLFLRSEQHCLDSSGKRVQGCALLNDKRGSLIHHLYNYIDPPNPTQMSFCAFLNDEMSSGHKLGVDSSPILKYLFTLFADD